MTFLMTLNKMTVMRITVMRTTLMRMTLTKMTHMRMTLKRRAIGRMTVFVITQQNKVSCLMFCCHAHENCSAECYCHSAKRHSTEFCGAVL